MRSALLILLLLKLITGSTAAAQAVEDRPEFLAIAFYNFENLFDTVDDPRKYDEEFTPAGDYHYTGAVYRAKLRNLATVLQKLGTGLAQDGPAIIGTAEIENARVLYDLAAQPEIRGRGYRFVHFDSPDPRGIDVALLYHPKYFSVLQARALYTDISASGEKGGKTRDVLYVTGILAGDTTHIFVNHWPSRRGGQSASAALRKLAASVSRRIIDSLFAQNAAMRVIVMGDLNDNPSDASIRQGLGAGGNIRRIGPGALYNPWVAKLQRGIGTLGFNDAWNLFDQILLSDAWLRKDGLHWKYDHSEVFDRDFLKEHFGRYKGYPLRSFEGGSWINGYSDHFPVIIYLIRGD